MSFDIGVMMNMYFNSEIYYVEFEDSNESLPYLWSVEEMHEIQHIYQVKTTKEVIIGYGSNYPFKLKQRYLYDDIEQRKRTWVKYVK